MPPIEPNAIKELLQHWFGRSVFEMPDMLFADEVFCRQLSEIYATDYARYFPDQPLILQQTTRRIELIGILLYRMARIAYLQGNEPAAEALSNLGRFISGFEIYYTASIGPGLKINHGLGTVVGARVQIGKNCLLHQGVTLGDRNGGRPVLRDNVTVYAGAKIIGGITIGNAAIVGANCVCMKDVPDNGVIAGVPGRIITKDHE